MALLLVASMSYAQPKTNVARECVLFELYTGVNCPYCPAAANAVAQMLEEGLAIAPVAYHTSAFSTALYYTAETNARAQYYNISAYPTLMADGLLKFEGGGNASQTNYNQYKNFYNQRINQTSPFTIDLSCAPDASGQWTVHCTVTQVGECSATNLKVMIALTQCNINVGWQGMQGLHHVCRDLIPTQMGTPFTGPSMTIEQAIDMNWPKDDCFVTAWVQNYNAPREVFQAVRIPLAMDLDYDLVLSDVTTTSPTNCSGVVQPTLTVLNSGHETVTGFDIVAYADGQQVFVDSWTGSLPTGSKVECPMSVFSMGGDAQLVLKVVSPNGHDDGFEGDNLRAVAFEETPVIDGYMKMQFKTDNNPEETTVQIVNMDTEEVAQEFTFTEPKTMYTEEFVLAHAGCYRIRILDAGGNGLGTGAVFGFKDSTGEYLFRGNASSEFTDELVFEFACDGTLSVQEPLAPKATVYPNPSSGRFNLSLGEGDWRVEVYDVTGRLVKQQRQASEGVIDLSGCGNGVYFLKASNGSKDIVEKLMVY